MVRQIQTEQQSGVAYMLIYSAKSQNSIFDGHIIKQASVSNTSYNKL